jgi:hypothetical protein
VTLRVAALAAVIVGVMLVLSSWDGLWEPLDLPQGYPVLTAQMGGMALLALAYLLWAASTRAELAQVAAVAGVIGLGGGAAVIAAWLLFRERIDLGIGDLGIALLAGTAAVLALVALALVAVAAAVRR